MIFEIKTKKDKRIEALERQVECMLFKRPSLISSKGNVVTMGASQLLEDGMPVEVAKREIALKLAEDSIKFIHYDVVNVGAKFELKGYIQVVTWGNTE